MTASSRSELFGGPMDGDWRTSTNDSLYYKAHEPDCVHVYVRTDRGYEWQGLAPMRDDMKVYVLKPGQRS